MLAVYGFPEVLEPLFQFSALVELVSSLDKGFCEILKVVGASFFARGVIE